MATRYVAGRRLHPIDYYFDVPANTTGTVSFFLDNNQNPYDGNLGLLGGVSANVSNVNDKSGVFSATVASDAPVGEYYVFGKITSNSTGKTRYSYADKTLTVMPATTDTDPFQYTVASYQTAQSITSKLLSVDIDGDDDIDLLARMSGGFQVLENQSGTGFTARTYWAISSDTNYTPADIVSFDINDDGRSDLIISSNDKVFTYESVTTDSWTDFREYVDSQGRSFGYLGTGDFNRDGSQDVVAVLGTGLQLLFGDNNGSFSWGPYVEAGFDIGKIAVGDINGDGFLDVAGIHDTTIAVFAGNSSGELIYQYDRELGAPFPLKDLSDCRLKRRWIF